MGNVCGGSKNPTKKDVEEKKVSKKIDDDMIDNHATDSQVAKLLLLGAGDSGKSTIFKQFKKLYGSGFTDEEKASFIPVIYNNTIIAIKILSQQVSNYGGLKDESNREVQKTIDGLEGDEQIDMTLAKAIQQLWQDPGIQQTVLHRSKFQITDSCTYFMERILEFGKENYQPTLQDMFRTRVRTTGIVESKFKIDGNAFSVIDVGGQRNERKKWMHCFENVTSVLFVVGISSFDQTLYEDEKTNRMVEALNLWDETCNSKYFVDTPMILFLNKMDILQEKLKRVSFKEFFPEYSGDNTFQDVVNFIQNLFERRNKRQGKEIYTHVTEATDTRNVQAVFNAVRDIVIRTSLKEAGLDY